MTDELEHLAHVLRTYLRRQGAAAEVTASPALGLIVTFEARWPFQLEDDQTGQTWTHSISIDPANVRGQDPALIADRLITSSEQELMLAVLGALSARAGSLGVDRRALAPFGARITEEIAERVTPFGVGGASDFVRAYGRQFAERP